MAKAASELDLARAEQAKQADAVRGWMQGRADAEVALAGYLDESARRLVDDPDALDAIAAEGDSMRARVWMCDQAADESVRRHLAASRAVLLAEAALFDGRISAARKALADHDAKVSELLAPLVELSGGPWIPDTSMADVGGGRNARKLTVRESLDFKVRELVEAKRSVVGAADGVGPLVLTDPAWAAASEALLAAGGSLSAGSARHLQAFADVVDSEAAGAADRLGEIVWALHQARAEWVAANRPKVMDVPRADLWTGDAPKYTAQLRAQEKWDREHGGRRSPEFLVSEWFAPDESVADLQRQALELIGEHAELLARAERLRSLPVREAAVA
jgi:hypothetical protein